VDLVAGKRILVVEDEALIAVMLVDILKGLGAEVVGPAATVEQALTIVESVTIDAAILDVNLRNVRVDPLSDKLRARGVPLVFATGYGKSFTATTKGAPVLDKPYSSESVASALRLCLTPPALHL
jgi:CheY-like chemotaxis protein